MKNIKKYISVFLVIAILVASPIELLASALATETEVCTAELFQAGSFDINYDRDYSAYYDDNLVTVSSGEFDVNMTDTEKTLEDRIYQALLNHQSAINFYLTEKLSSDWCKTMYTDVINDHPDLFYVSQTYATTSTFGVVTCITPYYTMESSEIDSAKIVFNAGVEKITALVDDTMSDLQKALVIHDYVCSNAIYKDNGSISHSAWGFFYDGYIVCAGYALVYSYLMKQVGVECELITSASHGWNAIKIDGNWYNVDLTWDDVSIADTPWVQDGAVCHKYFMKSTSFFDAPNLTGYSSHETSDTFDDCDRTDTSYDSGAFWEDVDNCIYVIDGKYYYLDPYYSNKYVILKQRTQSGSEINYLYNAYDLTATSRFSCNGNDYYNPTTLYCALCMFDGKLIVTNKDSLYRITDNAKAIKICSLTDGTGVGEKDGRIIYFQKGVSGYSTVNISDYAKTYFGDYYKDEYAKSLDLNNDGVLNAKDYANLLKQGNI